MSDIPDLKWLPLANTSGWFADHIGLKQGRKVLLRAFADGSVLARGIRPPDREFVAIPKGVWSSGQINWRASTVVDFPDVYQSVQVDRLQLVRLLRQPGETVRSAGQLDLYRMGVPTKAATEKTKEVFQELVGECRTRGHRMSHNQAFGALKARGENISGLQFRSEIWKPLAPDDWRKPGAIPKDMRVDPKK